MAEKTSIGEVIADSIELRREYEARRDRYARLLNLVALVLNSAIKKNKIKIHSMKRRLKTYKSFFEKVERKRYNDPFVQCTDIAGCRIVCLFLSQIETIKKIIESEFEVIEVTDKRNSKKYDQFGYLSLHMLVRVPKNRLRFVECSDLEGLVCEIQIRTILQEAWAEIEHHVNYKAAKEEKDQELLRKIFSLAGTFELADSMFEEIHRGFSSLATRKLGSIEEGITALTLFRFSIEHFPWYKKEWDKREERSFLKLSREVKNINVKSIRQIRDILDKYKKELLLYERYYKEKDNKGRDERYFTPVGLIRAALALEYGNKFDLVFGLKGYSDKVKKEIRSLG